MEYLECKFSVELHEADMKVRLTTQTIFKSGSFKCLGSWGVKMMLHIALGWIDEMEACLWSVV